MKNNQNPTPGDPAPTRPAHQSEDVRAPAILLFAGGVVALIGVCILAALAVLRITADREKLAPEQAEISASPVASPPLPTTRLQVAPQAELQAFARAKAQALHSYAWVDRRTGQVRIPIAQAIALAAQRGLPVFTAAHPIPKEP